MGTIEPLAGSASPSRKIGRPALSEIVRTPIRPLGPLSDFVVERMPARLKAIRENDPRAADEFLQEATRLSQGIVFDGMDEEALKVAWMDLCFLEAGLTHSSISVPEDLTAATNTVATRLGNVPMITYQSYIIDNPLDTDPRLFLTEDDGGDAELFFCQLHAVVEEELKPLFDMLMGVLEGGEVERTILQEGVAKMKKVSELMGEMSKRLAVSAFTIFRIYLASNTARGYAGASGAFSAAFPALDQILLDVALRPVESESAEPRLWPRKNTGNDWYVSWSDIFRAKDNRSERVTMLEKIQNAGCNDLLDELLKFLSAFRQKHLATVRKTLPKVWEGEALPTGSGGEFYAGESGQTAKSAVKVFLDGQKERVDATRQRLSQETGERAAAVISNIPKD